ncbi:MAG: MFS transporter [Planctomycetes bacterium]|nr:MFS transporter [Planctomycetota bacterium]
MMHFLAGGLMIGYVISPVYLRTLGLTIVGVGALYTIADLARVGLTYLAGRWLDGRGARTGIILDWWLSAVSCAIYAVSTRFWHLVLGELAEKASALFRAGYAAYQNEAYEEPHRERLLAYQMALPYLVQVPVFPLVALVLAYWWTDVTAYRVVIGACGAGMVALGVYCRRCLPNLGVVSAGERPPLWPRVPRSLLALMAVELLINASVVIGSGFVTAFLILERFQGTVLDVVLLHVLWGVVTVLTSSLTRNWNIHFSRRQLLCGGVALWIVSNAVLLASQRIGWLLLSYGLAAAGTAVWFAQHESLKMSLVPEGRRNEFYACVQALQNLIGLPLPLLTGLLAARFGLKAPFAIQLLGWVAVWVAYWRLLRHRTAN